MTVLKTRAKLVDVARQLFAKKGVEDTTMNDIAVASKKGRRTLYTYFKSKEEIYMAVVEAEIEMLYQTLNKVAQKDISPEKKILELIFTHLESTKTIVYRNGTLRADFFRDIWKVEAERKDFDIKEVALFRKILKEGREFGVGTILSTQFLKHFGNGDDDYAKYILTWVVHNVADLKSADVEFVFKAEAKSSEGQTLYNDIKALQKHHSIVKISSQKPQYIEDKAFWQLYSELNLD